MKTKPIIFFIIAIVLLAGLFFLFKPKSLSQTVPVNSESAEKTFEIAVKDRKVLSGPENIKVNEGDSVNIKITVNEDEELHLHGYDKSIDLEKDVPGELSFIANMTGRFSYELEKSKTELGALEVTPK